MAGKHIQSRTVEEKKSHTAVRTKRKKLGPKKVALVIVGCIAVLALVIAGVWAAFIKPPDVSHNIRPGGTVNQTDDTETGDEPDTAAGRKDGFYTFLLIGRDTGGGGNTDTLILVSYDVPNDQVNMVSIPRDMIVNVSWSTKKINSVYNAKESNGGGIEGLKAQVGYLTGVVPDFYVIIEWEAVGKLVEALGGVEFDVPRNMNYDDPYQNLHIHLEKGQQLLNGEQAMAMLRYRHDNDTRYGYGDTGRADTQREFLKAMAKEVLQLGNITKIGEFISIFMEYVKTDLELGELMWFASQAMDVNVADMESFTLPYEDVQIYRGAYYFMPVPGETVTMINEYFNPYLRDITEKDLQVVQRNSDGSAYVTNGTLLDSRWAKPTSSGSSSGSSGGSSSSGNSGGETTTPPEEETTDPNTGETTDSGAGETTDLGTGETPGSGETTDPGTGETTDPGTGETIDPGTGTTTDPGTGETTDPGTGTTTDPGTGGTTDPGTGGATDPGTGTPDDTVPPDWLG